MNFSIRGRHIELHPVVALAMIIVAPLAALLVQMAISRSREFGADTTGPSLAIR
jgi:heat shock protein HtpX